MFMLSFVREKHGLHHVLEKNSNKDINPFQKGSKHRASDHISPRNFFLLWTTLFEIWLLQKVFVPWCWVWVFFYPQLSGFYALRFSWAGSASPKQEQPHWEQQEEREAPGKGCTLGWALHPWSFLSQTHVHCSPVAGPQVGAETNPRAQSAPRIKTPDWQYIKNQNLFQI